VFGAIDNSRIGGSYIRPYVANLAALDQHVCVCEVAYGAIEREHNSVLEENASRGLHKRKFWVARLSQRRTGERRKCCPCRDNAAARFQEIATR
jgi:hypothetical protein